MSTLAGRQRCIAATNASISLSKVAFTRMATGKMWDREKEESWKEEKKTRGGKGGRRDDEDSVGLRNNHPAGTSKYFRQDRTMIWGIHRNHKT